jgi:hypothetical protein
MLFVSEPEIIGTVRTTTPTGDGDTSHGDRVVGIEVEPCTPDCSDAVVTIDVRHLGKVPASDHLMIDVPLQALMAALVAATLNTSR